MYRCWRIPSVVIALWLPLFSCGGGEKEYGDSAREAAGSPVKKVKMEELISHLPSDFIPAAGPIRIKFFEKQAEPRQSGVKMSKQPLSFEPRIDGYLAWEDEFTLSYFPSEKLERGVRYKGVLDVSRLLEGIDVETAVEFTFQVAEMELENVTSSISAAEAGKTNKVRLEAKLTFVDPVKPEDVKDKIAFTVDEKKTEFTVERGENERTLVLRSEPIQKTEFRRSASLTLNGSITGGEEYLQTYSIPPDREFGVSSMAAVHDEDPIGLDIHFSDMLDQSRDYSAFVSVEPETEFRVTVSGQTMRVRGPFERGLEYAFELKPGVTGGSGEISTAEENWRVRFNHLDPQIQFDQVGVFLPFEGKRSISFRAINMDSVVLEIEEVFASNLGQFLQVNGLNDSGENRWGYRDLQRVAKRVHSQVLKPGVKRDVWERFELDLGRLLDGRRKAAFVVQLHGWENRGWPYNISKLLISTDLGITAKWSKNKLYVFAGSISSGGPVSGARVVLYSKQLQVLAEGVSDSDGKIEFKNEDNDALYIAVEKGRDRSYLHTFRDSWKISGFETGGVETDPEGINAFIYTDRGVYRPGDTVHLTCVARNRERTFPAGHPVTFRLFNPRGQLIDTRVSTDGHNGMYRFDIPGNSSDMTGSWQAELLVGDRSFRHDIKVETVIPNRLKVDLSLPDTVSRDKFDVSIESKWLFGAPASGLKGQSEMWLRPAERRFKGYPEFIFSNPMYEFEQSRETIWEGELSESGQAEFVAQPKKGGIIPSALDGFVKARIFEKGGNFTEEVHPVFVDAYETYTGIQPIKVQWGFLQAGQTQKVPLVVLDRTGNPVPGRRLKVRVLHNSRYWWWDYEQGRSDRFRFRDDKFTRTIRENFIVTGRGPVDFDFTPELDGQYYIEALDEKSGHSTGWIFNAASWGSDTRSTPRRADLLNMVSDRKVYAPGDVARFRVETPAAGSALVTLEKGGAVLWSSRLEVKGDRLEFEVPVTDRMLPNAYVTVSLFQPQTGRANDLPLRLYGIAPLMVEDPRTHLPLDLVVSDELSPNRDFTVELSLEDNREGWATLAVVDEGLLDLTDFGTPDPWKHFYAKEKLGVETSDLYDNVLDVVRGSIGQRYTIGGDFDTARRKRAAPDQSRRFRPVALFSGPLRIAAGKSVKVPLRMPNYIGAVRVMAVSVSDGAYCAVDKSVPVKTPLIVLPTVPRVIGPGEEFELPVTVFALENLPVNARIMVETDSLLLPVGERELSLSFDKPGSQVASFRLRAAETVGQSRIRVSARGGTSQSEETIFLTLRPSNPLITVGLDTLLNVGKPIELDIPRVGLPGTNTTRLVVSSTPELNISTRLEQLVRYPYGCLEQTVSAAFPQLYLKDLTLLDKRQFDSVDDNINLALSKMGQFQLSDGYFTFWPGFNFMEQHSWAHAYAGHFLLAAREKGYYVPPNLIDSWIAFTSREVKNWPLQKWQHKVQVYNLFLLALAERSQMSTMNWVRENRLDSLDNSGRWLLASAYQLSGRVDIARRLLSGIDISETPYRETGRTFGSVFRDRALVLYLADLIGEDLVAARLFKTVADQFSPVDRYFSTQETAFALMAFGRYLQKHKAEGTESQVEMSLSGGPATRLDLSGGRRSVNLTGHEGGRLRLSSVSGPPLYVVLQSDGIPLDPEIKAESYGLSLDVAWMDEDGAAIDPGSLEQGRSFWACFTVNRRTQDELEALALSAVFPAGWEIDNLRLNEGNRPDWMKRLKLGAEEYVDIRDDRVNWFFDLENSNLKTMQFVVHLTATYSGEYRLPAASVEAMYDPRIFARVAGRRVTVTGGQ